VPTHQLHSEDETTYFVTFTCYKWLPLFEITDTYQEVYNWFNIIEEKGARVVGYVIMPNHVHCLIYIKEGGENLNKLVANGKRFMAYKILSQLKILKHKSVLAILAAGVQKNERDKGKLHKVFRLSFDAKECFDDKMIAEKLDYIHTNPVNGKWHLVKDYAEYEYSSDGFYENEIEDKYCNILHFRDEP
jgi:REP element-mobilizing transposase RayT